MYSKEISAFMEKLLETQILLEEINLKTVKKKRLNFSQSETN